MCAVIIVKLLELLTFKYINNSMLIDAKIFKSSDCLDTLYMDT